MAKRVLITGANRGIGLGLAQKFLVEGYEVIAGMRHPDGARCIWELESEFPGKLSSIELDVTSAASIKSAVQKVEGHLDILINNAGVLPNGSAGFSDLKEEDLLKAFAVNTMGPVKITQAFLPKILESANPKVINISTKVASISDNAGGGSYAYRMSKTALNMINKNLSIEFPEVVFAVLHPGWVKTDMGGENAILDVIDSTNGMYNVIAGLDKKSTGKFYNYDGTEIPW